MMTRIQWATIAGIAMTFGGLHQWPCADAAPLPVPGKSPNNEKIRDLQQQRVKALEEQMDGQFDRVKIGKEHLGVYIELICELGEAEADVAKNRKDETAAMGRVVTKLRETEDVVKELAKMGLQTKQAVAQIRAARLKAEIKLEKRSPEK